MPGRCRVSAGSVRGRCGVGVGTAGTGRNPREEQAPNLTSKPTPGVELRLIASPLCLPLGEVTGDAGSPPGEVSFPLLRPCLLARAAPSPLASTWTPWALPGACFLLVSQALGRAKCLTQMTHVL